jgi:hypothetical protein
LVRRGGGGDKIREKMPGRRISETLCKGRGIGELRGHGGREEKLNKY